MASKNRTRNLIRDIVNAACSYAESDYPSEDGYRVDQHKNEIWVDKWSTKYKGYLPVLTIEIKRC